MQVVENGFGTQVMYGEKRGASSSSTSLFVVKRVVFTQLSGLLPLFHFFFPLFVLSYSKFRKVEFLKKNRAEEKSLFPMDLRHIPSIFKTLKAYLGLHFHTIFDFVCHGISSPECLMPKDFEFEKCMESKGRHLSTFCPPVSHIDAYQFTLIELIGALCVQGVGK